MATIVPTIEQVNLEINNKLNAIVMKVKVKYS